VGGHWAGQGTGKVWLVLGCVAALRWCVRLWSGALFVKRDWLKPWDRALISLKFGPTVG
jgi:hypothetical protein